MDKVLESLKEIFSEVLLCTEAELNLDKPYVDMGVDSILAIQISKLIKYKLNKDIQPSELYNFISIKDLSIFLEGHIETTELINQSIGPNNNDSSDNSSDPVVIVGMAGIFPGASDTNQFWNNLTHRVSSIKPAKRWNGTDYQGGFLDHIDSFDADFFNISPKEARLMDPQQRLLIQIAWQAFENGGYTKTSLAGSKGGVFTTALPGDYRYLLDKNNQAYDTFSFTGNAVSVQAGRISHFFNLKGPCLNIDTACSSSLVCIDQATKAIQADECDFAFVGASSIFSTPEIFRLTDSAGILSKTGHCYSFDTRADGFIPAEVVAGLVLTRLSLAKKQNRKIYAQIESISTSHDGFTNGLMSPNGKSQQELIQSIYKGKKISPEQVGYIEAHGTGTRIGDPLEFNAVTQVLNQEKCYIGTCKANIGHALVASGLASIIKVLKAIQNKKIPPQINFHTLNPQINPSKVQVNTESIDWPAEKPLAGISSFGFGGTNSHLVLKHYDEKVTHYQTQGKHLFIFSAYSQKSLKAYIESFLPFVDSLEEKHITELSYTLCCRREIHKERLVVIASTLENLREQLQKYLVVETNPFIKEVPNNDDVYLLGKKAIEGKEFSCDSLFPEKPSMLDLPPYAFRGKSYWVDEPPSVDSQASEKLEKSSQTLDILKQKLSEILGYSINDISETETIKSFGIDSLIALQLLEPFKNKTGSLAPDTIFNQETLRDLAHFIDNSQIPNNSSATFENKRDEAGQLGWRIEGIPCEKIILLLPPLNTCSQIWEHQIQYFVKKGYQVFIPHYPGHAGTPYFNFDLQELADIIWKEFCLKAGTFKKVSVFGWSLGGCLSLLLAEKYSDQISNFILINTASKFEKDLFSQSPKLRHELENKGSYLKQFFKKQNLQAIELIGAGCSLDILKHYYQQLSSFNVINSLRKIKSSCMIIFGEKDPVINHDDLKELLEIPGSISETFQNDGHFVPLTSPYRFNIISERFIS
tara:strand:- start:4653 stop:7601 length:2949 start_codon:yes stop_codon:yes gene_type:complete